MKGTIREPNELPGSNLRDGTAFKDFANGFVYIVQAEELVKVGKTVEPRQRLKTHFREMKKYGKDVTRFWLSPPHWTYSENEDSLLEAVRGFSETRSSGREFFTASFQKAVDAAEELNFPWISEDEKALKYHPQWVEMRSVLESSARESWTSRLMQMNTEPRMEVLDAVSIMLSELPPQQAAYLVSGLDELDEVRERLIRSIEEQYRQMSLIISGGGETGQEAA